MIYHLVFDHVLSLFPESCNSFLIVLFQVTPSELTTFANNYGATEYFQANGITLAGTRFIFLSQFERVVRGKKNKSGLHCMKTEKGEVVHCVCTLSCLRLILLFAAIVVSIYEEPTTPQQAANVVEKLGEYLMGHGY